MAWTLICSTADVGDQELKEFDTEAGFAVLVGRAGDDFFVYPPMCPHLDEPLKNGLCDGATITCMKHLWEFDMRTGEPLGMAEAPMKLYESKVEDGGVYARLMEELVYPR